MKKPLLFLSVFFLFIGSISAKSYAQGRFDKKLHYGGYEREYAVYTPTTAKSTDISGVILCLHPFMGKYEEFYGDGKYSAVELANKLNLLIITPQALPEKSERILNLIKTLKNFSPSVPDLRSAWGCGLEVTVKIKNDDTLVQQLGIPKSIELNKAIDDTGFIDAILEKTLTEYNLSEKKIFVLGLSMGAYMSYQYALTHGEKLSGLISIVGSMGLAVKNKDKAVKLPICDFHSTTDEVVPYKGFQEHSISLFGKELNLDVHLAEPKEEVIKFWVETNGANTNPLIEPINYYQSSNDKTVAKYTYKCDKNEVVHYKLHGAGHNYFFKKKNGDRMDYYEEVAKFIAPKIATTNIKKIESDVSDKVISFYPNPAKDLIHFSTDQAVVEIYSISGQKLMSTNLTSSSLNIGSLNKGIYIMQISTKHNKQKEKLIVR